MGLLFPEEKTWERRAQKPVRAAVEAAVIVPPQPGCSMTERLGACAAPQDTAWRSLGFWGFLPPPLLSPRAECPASAKFGPTHMAAPRSCQVSLLGVTGLLLVASSLCRALRTQGKDMPPTCRHTGHRVRGTQTVIPCRDPLQPFMLEQASSWLFSPIPARFPWRHQRCWLPQGSKAVTLPQDTSSSLGCCDLSPCNSCAHPCVPNLCGSPPCSGAGWGLFPMAASTARSQPQG